MARVVKPANAYVWDVRKPTMHGSEPRNEGAKILGNLWSRASTQPSTHRPGRGRGSPGRGRAR